jgi:hypothetical protein
MYKSSCLASASALSVTKLMTALGMYLVTLCCASQVQLGFSREAGLLNKGSFLARALGVTKFIK